MSEFRIGSGFDVHAFAAGRKCIIGGVDIPHALGLQGHSDADVLLHAISDALLGALGLGDIGHWFPDTDEKWKGADSMLLLAEVWKEVRAGGWTLENIDATVLAERPKLAPHIPLMAERIASVLETEKSRVSIKATTSERLGFIGREEGVAAQATLLLRR